MFTEKYGVLTHGHMALTPLAPILSEALPKASARRGGRPACPRRRSPAPQAGAGPRAVGAWRGSHEPRTFGGLGTALSGSKLGSKLAKGLRFIAIVAKGARKKSWLLGKVVD